MEKSPLHKSFDHVDHEPDIRFRESLRADLLQSLAEGPGVTSVDANEEQSRDSADDVTDIDIVDIAPVPSQRRVQALVDRPLFRRVVLTAAAAAVLLVGTLAVIRTDMDNDSSLAVASGDGSPTTAIVDDPVPTPVTALPPVSTPGPVTSEQQIAIDFLTARSSHDGAAMRVLLADDATLANDYGIVTIDDYLDRTEFERLTNTEISDIDCEPLPSSDRVSCQFSFQNDIGRHMRPAPYRFEMIATIRDGLIVDLLAATNGITFEADFELFLDWLSQAHPEDLAAVVDEPTFATSIEMRVTPASGAIVAARVSEFAATTLPTITKLLADDPRFTTLADALEGKLLGDGLSVCLGTTRQTIFAPTNSAIERYIVASGLDRETALGDPALFETLVVGQMITIAGTAGMGAQPVDFETESGETITVTGGVEPRVQGVPLLADAIDIAACNGVIQGIDEIYIPND